MWKTKYLQIFNLQLSELQFPDIVTSILHLQNALTYIFKNIFYHIGQISQFFSKVLTHHLYPYVEPLGKKNGKGRI